MSRNTGERRAHWSWRARRISHIRGQRAVWAKVHGRYGSIRGGLGGIAAWQLPSCSSGGRHPLPDCGACAVSTCVLLNVLQTSLEMCDLFSFSKVFRQCQVWIFGSENIIARKKCSRNGRFKFCTFTASILCTFYVRYHLYIQIQAWLHRGDSLPLKRLYPAINIWFFWCQVWRHHQPCIRGQILKIGTHEDHEFFNHKRGQGGGS